MTLPIFVFWGIGFRGNSIMVPCESFNEVSKAVTEIKSNIEKLKLPLLDITTIPCVSYNNIKAGQLDSKENVEALLLVSLAGGSEKEILEELRTDGGKDVLSTFGFHDVTARFDLPLKQLIELLLKIRSENERFSIYSTSTIIRHSYDTASRLSSITWTGTTPDDKITKCLAKTPEMLDDFGYYYNVFLALATDPFAKYLLKDLTPFFSELLEIYEAASSVIKVDKEAYHEQMELYDTVIDSLRLIFQQRCSGIQIPNLLGLKNLNLESYGGSLKILLSHEALVNYYLKTFGVTWTGCSVFGYAHKFYWVEGGIINMPNNTKMKPEEWWGSGHEVGHEAFNRLEQTNGEIYRRMEEQREAMLKTGKKEFFQEDSFELLWESFADAFDFYFGFFSDWDYYCKIVWTYLAEKYKLNPNYLTRMLLVYFVFGPGSKNKPTSKSALIAEIKKLTTLAKQVDPKIVFSDSEKKEAILKYLFLLKEFTIAKEAFPFIRAFQIEDADKIDEALGQGICVKIEPNVLVNAMTRKNDNKTLKYRLAAILSLYNDV